MKVLMKGFVAIKGFNINKFVLAVVIEVFFFHFEKHTTHPFIFFIFLVSGSFVNTISINVFLQVFLVTEFIPAVFVFHDLTYMMVI